MTFFKCLQRAHSFMLRVWFHLFYKDKTHELLLQAPICHGSFATQKYHCKWNKMLFVIWLVIPMLQSTLLWFWKLWHEITIGSSVQSASSRLQKGWGAFLTQNRQFWKFKPKGKENLWLWCFCILENSSILSVVCFSCLFTLPVFLPSDCQLQGLIDASKFVELKKSYMQFVTNFSIFLSFKKDNREDAGKCDRMAC